MTTTILFAAPSASWNDYKDRLTNLFKDRGHDITLTQTTSTPENVDYIIYAPNGPLKDFTPYKNVKLVQSLWAGVELILQNKTMALPLARMVDPGMSAGMADYVLGHVMYHHLGIASHNSAKAGEWLADTAAPLTSNRTVGFLGLGALGMYCAHAVARQGFNVLGWSRNEKSDDTIHCYSGASGLNYVLGNSDMIVLLMPETVETTNIINSQTISQMKDGAHIINPGRGPLIDDTALLHALDTGKLSGATLDVFRTEPLPADHPYWAHPKVLVTPHIASETRPETAAIVAVENICRGIAGEPFLHLANPEHGY